MRARNIEIKKYVYYLILVSVLSLTFIFFLQELCEMWQTPKDKWCILSVVLSLVAVFLIRKIPLKKFEVWGALICGALFLVFWFRHKEINVANYGEVYFRVLAYTWISWMLFVVLFVDLFRASGILSFLRANWWKLILYILFVVITVTTNKEFLIPVLCPIFAFITTNKSKEEWLAVCDCAGIAYYISYVFMMTKSLLVAPEAFQSGRYMGVFLSVENMGAFCGMAFVCVLYLGIRIAHLPNRKWYSFIIPILLAVYPIYGVLVNASRTTQMALILTVLFAFVFMHRKGGAKETAKRFLFALLAIVILAVGLFVLAKIFDKELKSGKVYSPRQKYIIAHIAKLADDEHDSHYFEKGSILNALDGFSSKRLRCWAEAAKQIEFEGHLYEIREPLKFASPHNFFLQKMIEMGWIKGILFNAYIFASLGVGLYACLKRDDSIVFPTLWMLYSIPVLGSTIISWNSILSYGLLLSANIILFNVSYPKKNSKEGDC